MQTSQVVLRAAESALGELDGPVTVTKSRTYAHRQRLRQAALEQVEEDWKSSPSEKILSEPSIRTNHDTLSLPIPKPRAIRAHY